jgi:hypothetical protein
MKADADGSKPFTLGILFVHGIGTQTRGETLTSFGGPFCKWLEHRCSALAQSQQIDTDAVTRSQKALEKADWSNADLPRTLDRASDVPVNLHRVVLRETTFQDQTDPEAPANTKLGLLSVDANEQVSAENWLLAESWWADRFASPSFGDLARWSFGVLPWIVGSHFGAQIQRRLHERPSFSSKPVPGNEPVPGKQTGTNHHVWAIALWTWTLMAAIGAFGLGLLSTLVTMPLLALFLVVGLVPIPSVRSALLNIQLRMAAIVGDCFVLLARPIEAASIVSAVRRDLQWMASKCSEVVVVAHSQGGAVAHLALRGTVPGELKLLFTFGSGLRKLEEARELMRSPASFGLSAVATSIALFILLLCTTFVFFAIVDQQQNLASIGLVLAYGVAAAAFLAAGIRDHLRGIRLQELERWIEWLDEKKLRWRDCYATADPVPNGTVAAAVEDRTLKVCNRSSMLSDHTSYWINLDEFVSALYGEISQCRSKDPLPLLRIETPIVERIGRRRRWRVAVARYIEWTTAVGVLAVLAHEWYACKAFLVWAWSRTGAPIVKSVLGMSFNDVAGYSIDWETVGLLALLLGASLVVRVLWNAWDHNEMRRWLGLRSSGNETTVLVALWFLSIITLHLVRFTTDLSAWLWALAFVPSMVFLVLKPSVSDRPRQSSDEQKASSKKEQPAGSDTTSVETLVSTTLGIGMAAALPYSLGLAGWDALIWLIENVRPSLGEVFGFPLESIPGEAVGAVAVLVSAAAWLFVSMRQKSRAASPAAVGQ